MDIPLKPGERFDLPLGVIAAVDARLVKRYQNDPVFFALVNTIEAGVWSKKFTLADVSQAMCVAEEKLTERNRKEGKA